MPLRIAGVRGQPDLIYARFLASHLPEPEQAISGWAKELEPGGLLLVEEVDSIRKVMPLAVCRFLWSPDYAGSGMVWPGRYCGRSG